MKPTLLALALLVCLGPGAVAGSARATSPKQAARDAAEPVERRLGELEARLAAVERGASGLDEIGRLRKDHEELVAKLEALDTELRRRVDALETSAKRRCVRVDGTFDGRDEVLVAVGDGVLRFLRVRPPTEPLMIGLSEERAGELYREAQEGVAVPLLPWIYRSVPAVSRTVGAFLLQDRLIDPRFYAEVMAGADAREVSVEQANRFLTELNTRCTGVAEFALPSEEEFVAAARLVYDPAANGLKPCAALRRVGASLQLTQLLGHAWQLTRSPCQPFSENPCDRCPEGTYVRKGGAETSASALECLPEYRSAAPPDLAQPGTSFRLVLVGG